MFIFIMPLICQALGTFFFFSAQIGKRTVIGVFEAWDRGGGGGGGGVGVLITVYIATGSTISR